MWTSATREIVNKTKMTSLFGYSLGILLICGCGNQTDGLRAPSKFITGHPTFVGESFEHLTENRKVRYNSSGYAYQEDFPDNVYFDRAYYSAWSEHTDWNTTIAWFYKGSSIEKMSFVGHSKLSKSEMRKFTLEIIAECILKYGEDYIILDIEGPLHPDRPLPIIVWKVDDLGYVNFRYPSILLPGELQSYKRPLYKNYTLTISKHLPKRFQDSKESHMFTREILGIE